VWYAGMRESDSSYPAWDMTPRDKSGQTPLHEAAMHGNVITAQWLVSHGGHNGGGQDYDFEIDSGEVQVRALPLEREWAIGWTMMNWASLLALDLVARDPFYSTSQANVVQNNDLFVDTKGMSVMDYAVSNNQLEFVEWLMNNRANGGLTGLVSGTSNWGERPLHKAVTLGHQEIVEYLINHPGGGCDQITATALGGENLVHVAAAAGWDTILQFFKDRCPTQFEAARVSTLRFNDGLSIRYFWNGETACGLSENVIRTINLIHGTGDGTGGVCSNGDCRGNFRSYCSHDSNMFCYRDHDCHTAHAGSTCTFLHETIKRGDLVHHWRACALTCGNLFELSCLNPPPEYVP